MARFLTVLKPRSATTPGALIEALQPVLQGLQASGAAASGKAK